MEGGGESVKEFSSVGEERWGEEKKNRSNVEAEGSWEKMVAVKSSVLCEERGGDGGNGWQQWGGNYVN